MSDAAMLPGARTRFWQRFLSRTLSRRPMGVGTYLYVAHRLTGLALTLYLYVHLITLGSVLQGPEGFDRAMALMNRPAVRFMELALIWVVLFHALNGARLLLLAVHPAANPRWLGYAVVGLSFLAALLSLPLFLS